MTDEPQAKKAKVTQRSPLVRTSSVHHVAPPNRLIEDLSFYFVLFIVICHFFSFSFSFPFLFFSFLQDFRPEDHGLKPDFHLVDQAELKG